MRLTVVSALMLFSNISLSATPIDGWYTSVFGAYAYVPQYIQKTSGLKTWNNVNNQGGYDVGGNFGFKSNPMRYELEVSYLDVLIDDYTLNKIKQTTVSGHNSAVFGMSNVYYDFHGIPNPLLQPFLSVGIGYAWIQATIDSTGPLLNTKFSGANSVFAYQGQAGITYNFAENYSLYIGYRYVGTTNVPELGQMLQAHMANAGVTYRFAGNDYK